MGQTACYDANYAAFQPTEKKQDVSIVRFSDGRLSMRRAFVNSKRTATASAQQKFRIPIISSVFIYFAVRCYKWAVALKSFLFFHTQRRAKGSVELLLAHATEVLVILFFFFFYYFDNVRLFVKYARSLLEIQFST